MTISGIRILDGPISDSLEARGLNFKNQEIHLYSASWGPRDDGQTMEAPGEATIRAVKKGVKEVSYLNKHHKTSVYLLFQPPSVDSC